MDSLELKSPFDEIRRTEADGSQWWNSRDLARTLGYLKYWNFEHLVEKVAVFLQQQKGLKPQDHMIPFKEMRQTGNGAVREVESLKLSRVACMAIVSNADKKKPMVQLAKEYFGEALTPSELSVGMESNVLMYRSSRGKVQVAVVFNNETFWLSQQRMASLFGVDVSTINYHLKQLEQSGEVHMSESIRKIPIASETWSSDEALVYNLDVVIAVGYRVNSYEATQFRIWASGVLKEFLVKGFVLDDERLKGKSVFGIDYFDELLERIREIRASERRYYQKITDIYAECSIDYDRGSETTKLFYKTVQNMMHWAVTHHTAAEIVYDRADNEKPHMGLTTWKAAPDGRVVRSDVTVAKNYLSENEVERLNLLSGSFLDFAEMQAQRHILMTQDDWSEQLRKFLGLHELEVLCDAGKVTHEQAERKAYEEYDKFRIIQDRTVLSDFDKEIKELF